MSKKKKIFKHNTNLQWSLRVGYTSCYENFRVKFVEKISRNITYQKFINI